MVKHLVSASNANVRRVDRAQAIRQLASGFDPYKIDNEVRTSLTRRGVSFIDIYPASVANPEQN